MKYNIITYLKKIISYSKEADNTKKKMEKRRGRKLKQENDNKRAKTDPTLTPHSSAITETKAELQLGTGLVQTPVNMEASSPRTSSRRGSKPRLDYKVMASGKSRKTETETHPVHKDKRRTEAESPQKMPNGQSPSQEPKRRGRPKKIKSDVSFNAPHRNSPLSKRTTTEGEGKEAPHQKEAKGTRSQEVKVTKDVPTLPKSSPCPCPRSPEAGSVHGPSPVLRPEGESPKARMMINSSLQALRDVYLDTTAAQTSHRGHDQSKSEVGVLTEGHLDGYIHFELSARQ